DRPRALITITRAYKIEAGRLEGLGNQARIVGRRRKRSDLIASIADNKRKAFFGAGGAGLRQLPPLRRRHRALGRTIRNRRSPALGGCCLGWRGRRHQNGGFLY